MGKACSESAEHNGIYCNLLPLTCGSKKLFIEYQLRTVRFLVVCGAMIRIYFRFGMKGDFMANETRFSSVDAASVRLIDRLRSLFQL